jgi:hypothetical protein
MCGREVIRGTLADGTAFMTGTIFHGQAAMRISVFSWSTTEAGVDASFAALNQVAAGEPLVRARVARPASNGLTTHADFGAARVSPFESAAVTVARSVL